MRKFKDRLNFSVLKRRKYRHDICVTRYSLQIIKWYKMKCGETLMSKCDERL